MNTGLSRRGLLSIAAVSNFVYGMITSLAGALVPQLSTLLGLAPDQIGNVFLAQAAGMILASVCAGPVVDNRGKKAGLLLSLALIAAGVGGLPFSSSLTAVFLCMAVLGIGGGTLSTATNALISDLIPGKRATLLTLLKVFFGLGGFAMPFLAASIFRGNTIALCHIVAVVALATLGTVAVVAMPPPSRARRFQFSQFGVLARTPVLPLLACMVFLYVGCEVATFNWLAKHLTSRGVDSAAALKVVSLGFAMGLMAGRFAFAGILMKVRSITVTLLASAAMAVTTTAMLQATDQLACGVLACLAGLSMAPMFPAALAMTGDRFPRMTATALGVVLTSGWMGSAFTSKLIGAVAGSDSLRIKTGLLVLPVFSTLIFVLNLFLRPMLARPAQGSEWNGRDAAPPAITSRAAG